MVTLSDSDVHIWYRGTTSLGVDVVKSADRTLSIEERARRDRLQNEGDRRDFTIAHDLLRRALSRHADVPPTDWQFTTSEYGKPSIESADPQLLALAFNLSHTRGWVACAITSNMPLGVDVERIDKSRCVREIADRYFSEAETAWLRHCSNDLRNIRFTELWSLKEAFLKGAGVGLYGSLKSISFQFDGHAHINFSTLSAVDRHDWYFALFAPADDLRLAIAVQGAVRPRIFMREDEGDDHILAPIRASAS